MGFAKQDVIRVRSELTALLEQWGKQNGLGVLVGKINYSSDYINTEVKVIPLTSGISVEQAQFNRLCKYYGFLPENYGKVFVSNGKQFKFVGFVENAKKYPCLVTRLDTNEGYKFTANVVKKDLGILDRNITSGHTTLTLTDPNGNPI